MHLRDAPLHDFPSAPGWPSVPATVARVFADVGNRASEADRARALAALVPHTLSTSTRFAWLAAVCGADVVVGKLFESHLDAVAIWAELAPDTRPDAAQQLWAVWAADGPGAVHAAQTADGQWHVSGRKSWCSGAAEVDRALITARLPDGTSRMFAIALADPGVTVTDEGWDAIGMQRTRSVDVLLNAVVAVPIGAAGDYVGRRGFWHGAAGIAACWLGAASAIGERCRQRAVSLGDKADAHLLAHLGAIDVQLHAARAVLVDAAQAIDRCSASEAVMFGPREALRVRGLVEAVATEVIARTGRALGAAPLCRDAVHAQRVADLSVFMRQSHAERDLEAIGRLAAAAPACDWGW